MSLVDELRDRLPSGVDVDALAAFLVNRGVGSRGGRRRSRATRPEPPELGSASRRFARALASRATEGDTEALEVLVEVRAAVEESIEEAARSLHEFGYSWTEVGDLLGVTRQAARQRFGAREEVSS